MIRAKNLAFKFTAQLCIFLYLFPFQFKVLPLSNTRILQIIGAIGLLIYILYKKKIHTKILTFNYYGFIILITGIFSTIIVNESNQFNFALTKGLYIVLYSCSAFLIVSLLKKSNKNFTPIKALEAIIYVTIFQAIISLLFFCFPNIKDKTQIENKEKATTERKIKEIKNSYFWNWWSWLLCFRRTCKKWYRKFCIN